MKVLSEEDELLFEKNLVWVFADRRSGTTWLTHELLSYHTKVVDELLIGLHLGRVVEKKDGFERTLDTEMNRKDYFFSESYKETWIFFLRKLILNRIYNQFQNLSETIIIKEPTGSMAADIIAKCLPQSKIIIVLRDGRDIVDSKIDENSPGGWELEREKGGINQEITPTRRLNFIKVYSKRWVILMEILMKAYEKHHNDLRYLLKYENLRQDTFPEIQKIYKFIGIEINPETLEKIVKKYEFEDIPKEKRGKGQFRRFATPGKWKENFNEEEQLIMNSFMKDTIKKLNY